MRGHERRNDRKRCGAMRPKQERKMMKRDDEKQKETKNVEFTIKRNILTYMF